MKVELVMKLVTPCLLAAAMTISISSYAEISLSGFANMAGGITSGSDETLYGYDDTISFEHDSLFGVQANAILDDGLEAVVQIKSTGTENWEPVFEWAYVSYKVNDNIKFVLGRQRVPFYMYSDYVDVGYAYHWIRPPQSIYNLPFDSAEGLGVLFTNSVQDWDSTFHVLLARETSKIEIQGIDENMDQKNLMSVSWALVRDWLTLRASHTRSTLDLTIQGVDTLAAEWSLSEAELRALAEETNNANFNTIADRMASVPDRITFRDDEVSFTSLGAMIDYEPFLLAAEWTNLDLESGVYGSTDAFYLSAGFRVDPSVLIHLTYGENDDKSPDVNLDEIPQNVSSGIAPELDARVNALLTTTPLALGKSGGRSSYNTLGVRWDFHASAALKVEYTDFIDDVDSENDAKLFRFAISTVF